MSPQPCPLCHGAKVSCRARHNAQDLIKVYQDNYGIAVDRFFPETEIQTMVCGDCQLRWHASALPGDGPFYDDFQKHAFYYEKAKAEFLWALSVVESVGAKSILELGCGAGNFLELVRPGRQVVGSEISAAAREKLAAKGLVLDDGQGQFDVVCAFQVLEHVEDPKGFIEGALARLRPGGCLILSVPNPEAPYFVELFEPLDHPPHHLTQWTMACLSALAERYGLTVKATFVEPMRPEHYRGILNGRRKRRWGNSFLAKVFRRLLYYSDPLSIPFRQEWRQLPGHTHGVCLKKGAS